MDSSIGFAKEEHAILEQMPTQIPVLRVFNKIDQIGTNQPQYDKNTDNENSLFISAKYGQGIDTLKQTLKQQMDYQPEGESTFIARRRHLHALEETQQAVDHAEIQLTRYHAGELMAEELRIAQEALGKITGTFTADDLLGEIFSSFCIGK
jgi:tRNA modification GTPase